MKRLVLAAAIVACAPTMSKGPAVIEQRMAAADRIETSCYWSYKTSCMEECTESDSAKFFACATSCETHANDICPRWAARP